jgi:hypothetical protein
VALARGAKAAAASREAQIIPNRAAVLRQASKFMAKSLRNMAF